MTDRAMGESLLWISRRYAINLANVATVFRATNGHIEISFIGGQPLSCAEKDLTPEAAAILLPQSDPETAHLHLESSH
jgi:hypothetical protein